MSHLDLVFEKSAKTISRQVSGSRAKYKLDSLGYTVKPEDDGKTGNCVVRGVRYDRSLDCNVYDLLDEETGKGFSACEFEVALTYI